MPQPDDDARGRLQGSALELFREQGYDRTTAAEIAARAGVTERTFFRHFADKREVLFDGEVILRATLTAHINAAAVGLGPLELLFQAIKSLLPLMEANRPLSKPRQEIIASAPALAERELAKLATLADALATVLVSKGVGALQATLAARVGIAAFAQATSAWLDDPGMSLGARLDLAFDALKSLLK